MKLTTRDLTMSALGGLMIACSVYLIPPLQMTFLPVPFTLQVMVIVLISMMFPPKATVFSIVMYLMLGTFGLPVFSGGRSGLGVLLGPTGGFLFGFILLGGGISYLHKLNISTILKAFLYSLVIVVVFYPIASLWLSVSTQTPWWLAYSSMVPFMLLDLVKVIFAILLYMRIPLLVKSTIARINRYSDN